MGNTNSLEANSPFAIDHSDPVNGLLYLVDPASNEFVLREVELGHPQQAQRLYDVFERRCCLSHPHLGKLISIIIDQNGMGAKMLSECPFRTLEDQRTDRAFQSDSFEQQQLWSILASLILVLGYLQRQSVQHGGLRTHNIYLCSDGVVQVLDPLAKGYPTNYHFMLEDSFAEAYLSPNQFGCLVEKRPQPIHNPFKSDVYTLGVIVLELGLLQSQQHIYQRETLDYAQLRESIYRFKMKYSPQLSTIIEMMLEVNQIKRQDWLGLERFVKRGHGSLIGSRVDSQSQGEVRSERSTAQLPKSSQRQQDSTTSVNKSRLYEGLFFQEDQMSVSDSFQRSQRSQKSYRSTHSHHQESLMSNHSLSRQLSRLRPFETAAFPTHSTRLVQAQQQDKRSAVLEQNYMQSIKFQPNHVMTTSQKHPSNQDQDTPNQLIMTARHNSIYQSQSISPMTSKSNVFDQGKGGQLTTQQLVQTRPLQCEYKPQHPRSVRQNQPIVRTLGVINNLLEVLPTVSQPPTQHQLKSQTEPDLITNTPIARLQRMDKSIQMSGVQLPFFKLVEPPAPLNTSSNHPTLHQQKIQCEQQVQKIVLSVCKNFSVQNCELIESIHLSSSSKLGLNSLDQSIALGKNLIDSDAVPLDLENYSRVLDNNKQNSNPYKRKPKGQKVKATYLAQDDSGLIYTEPIGKGYTGEMKDGMRHGKGVYFHSKNGIYDGAWRLNKMHGYGRLYNTKGKLIYKGEWNNDHIHGKGVIYAQSPELLSGLSCWDTIHLKKHLVWYDGQFQMDKKKGQGVVRLSSGDIFQGVFSGDCIQGYGTLRGKEMTVKGVWTNSRLERVVSIE